jgi:hypothetical protein
LDEPDGFPMKLDDPSLLKFVFAVAPVFQSCASIWTVEPVKVRLRRTLSPEFTVAEKFSSPDPPVSGYTGVWLGPKTW